MSGEIHDASDSGGATTVTAAEAIDSDADTLTVQLICLWKDNATTRIVLEGGSDVVIGRGKEADIIVDDAQVSRRHAIVRKVAGGAVVRDLGSRNGTRVRGEVVHQSERTLAAGDSFKVGPLDVVVATESASAVDDDSRAVERGGADDSSRSASGGVDRSEGAPGIAVADPAMRQVFVLARRLAQMTTSVLLSGETGVGKEVVAEQIHRRGPRARGPYVRLNCAALPDTLLESELFGHEKGAFTGANARKIGLIEASHGGTLLLDEVGELALGTQAKLLRVLESRTLTRLGGTRETPIDIRIVCATHRDLKADIAAGRFREDLFYRISAFVVRVPPLRERRAEIAILADLFLRQLAARMHRTPPRLDAAAEVALATYPWPGNVRELRNVIEHALVLAEGDTVGREHLPEHVQRPPSDVANAASAGELEDKLASVEREAIVLALAAERGNQTRAAKRLGITRRALIYRMQQHHIH